MNLFRKRTAPSEQQNQVLDQIDREISKINNQYQHFAENQSREFLKKLQQIYANIPTVIEDYSLLDKICIDCKDELTELYLVKSKYEHLELFSGHMRMANLLQYANTFQAEMRKCRDIILDSVLAPTLKPFQPSSIDDKSGRQAAYYCYFKLDNEMNFIDSVKKIYKELDSEVKNLKNLN